MTCGWRSTSPIGQRTSIAHFECGAPATMKADLLDEPGRRRTGEPAGTSSTVPLTITSTVSLPLIVALLRPAVLRTCPVDKRGRAMAPHHRGNRLGCHSGQQDPLRPWPVASTRPATSPSPIRGRSAGEPVRQRAATSTNSGSPTAGSSDCASRNTARRRLRGHMTAK